MKRGGNREGMTLVEVLMAVVIIGMLAAILIPAVRFAMQTRRNAEAATMLRTAVQAFEMYRSEQGHWPPDQIVPGQTTVPLMEDHYFPYFGIDWWGDETPLGGRWDWDVDYNFAVSVSIWRPTASQAQLRRFDRMIDDGDLSTGRFRRVGTQYHYILVE